MATICNNSNQRWKGDRNRADGQVFDARPDVSLHGSIRLFINPGETETFYQQYVLDFHVAFSLRAGIPYFPLEPPLFLAHLAKLVSVYLGSLLAMRTIER